ncbi:MAG: hypothetical protein SVU32_02580 [Candidatus Nanohaloarchaea archaeon]|nr:hypothetical protein [Candidatus Nanohaloarchaea archaeon]
MDSALRGVFGYGNDELVEQFKTLRQQFLEQHSREEFRKILEEVDSDQGLFDGQVEAEDIATINDRLEQRLT